MLKLTKMLGYSMSAHGLLIGAILLFLAYPKFYLPMPEHAISVEIVTPTEVPGEKTPQEQPPTPAAQPSPASPQPSSAPARSAVPSAQVESRFDVAMSLQGFNIKIPEASFDAKASDQANLTRDQIAAFKARLKSCWRPGAGVGAASRTHVVLRISLRPDGAIAAEPALIEASAAPDGPAIMQAAIAAVVQCAPFGFLPRERYNEWKSMDVRFSPRDMSS